MKKNLIVTLALALCLVLCASVALAANYCINCGAYLGGAYNFCPDCGTKQPSAGTSTTTNNTNNNTNTNTNQNTTSSMTIDRISLNDDGSLQVSWTDGANNAPYNLYVLQKRSNSYASDSIQVVPAQLCQQDVYTTSAVADMVVPGSDYWIIVEDKNGNTTYKAYDGGTTPRFNEFSVKANIELKYCRDNAYEEVYAFSASDIRRYQNSTSYGAYIQLDYPQLARERQYTMLIAITSPNGDVVVDAVGEDILYRGNYNYYWNFYTFDEYFSIMIDAYGTMPTGTYTWSLYYDGLFVTSDTFRISN
ncbi:MAG: zinc ribbon domain-containing protein [Clostridia bacterium]|nr:zinc ribbon domain-containing protein [Clostridia bacterium]